jgi:hypothetical protein
MIIKRRKKVNKFFEFFNNKYSFSEENLINMYGEDYFSFKEMMRNKNLLDPKSPNKIIIMEKEIDKFMEDMTYSRGRRKRR